MTARSGLGWALAVAATLRTLASALNLAGVTSSRELSGAVARSVLAAVVALGIAALALAARRRHSAVALAAQPAAQPGAGRLVFTGAALLTPGHRGVDGQLLDRGLEPGRRSLRGRYRAIVSGLVQLVRGLGRLSRS